MNEKDKIYLTFLNDIGKAYVCGTNKKFIFRLKIQYER